MKFLLRICILVSFTSIFSCVTDDNTEINSATFYENTKSQLNDYMADNKYQKTLVRSEILLNEDGLIPEFRNSLLDYNEKARNGLLKSFGQAVETYDYDTAAAYLSSLNAAGVETGDNVSELYVKQTVLYLEGSEKSRGLIYFLDRIINRELETKLSDEQLNLIFNTALEQKNKAVLDFLVTDYPELSVDLKEAVSILDEKPKPFEMLKGTATIWVNRGIRIESGVGYPDRVIGSGFFIDKSGYLITNYHVIASEVDPEYEGYSRLYIKTDNSDIRIPAEVIGYDPSLDLALLKTSYEPEFIFNFSKTRSFTPGEKIFAIGSPGGLEKTITSGIISASGDRRLLPIGDTIQVDVPINAGNSGGPVVDENGDLVGIVFAGIEQFEGVNFIIPSRWVVHALPYLFDGGKMKKSWIGTAVYESHETGAENLDILYIDPSSSISGWRLNPGDRIISIDGTPVNRIADAQEILISKKPGSIIKLEVLSGEDRKQILVLTDERPDIPLADAIHGEEPYSIIPALFGMQISEGDSGFISKEYIINEVYPGMPADETGLSINDPFSISSWYYDDENEIILMNLKIKKRKAGFLETVIQLGSYLDINRVL